jgi:HK97 family phage portal protein
MAFVLDRAVAAQVEAKAIPAHPALRSNDPVSVYAPGAPRKQATITQRNAARHSDGYGGTQAIDWLYDCIGLYVDPAATAPYKLKDQDEGVTLVEKKRKGTPPDHKEGPQDLYRLFKQPNPYMLYDELMSLLVIDLLLVGNAYWLKWQVTSDGKPLALYRLAPAYVKIVPDKFGPLRYEYQPPGAKDPMKIAPENLVHFRRPNPHSAYYGMGVIQGAGRAMDIDIALTDTVASYYENKADPSMIVESERRVPRDVFNKLRAQLRARASGSKNAGELLVLENGLSANTLSPSASDALFNDLQKMSRDRLFTKFRASPMLFGILDETAAANKVSDLRREFDNYTLRPFLKKLSEAITASLTDAWGADFQIDHRTLLPAEDAVKVASEVAKLPAIKIRELRRQYEQFGIEESTGDPELDEELLNLPGENLGPDGQPLDPAKGGFADQPLGSEPGRPPKVGNTRSFSQPAKGQRVRTPQKKAFEDIVTNLEVLAAVEAAEGKAVLNPDGSRASVGNLLPGEVRPPDPAAQARGVDIDSARDMMAAGLRQNAVQLERDLLPSLEGKALKTSDIVKRVRSSDAWKSFRKNVIDTLTEAGRTTAASGVMHSGLTPDDEVDYDEVVSSVINRPEGVRSIVKTLRDKIVARVKDARSADAERAEFEQAVREGISEWSAGQVNTIADTEATHIYNESVLTAAELSGVTEVFVTDGDEHDEPCREADGQVWDLATARERRIEHPNCRRAFLPITEVA